MYVLSASVSTNDQRHTVSVVNVFWILVFVIVENVRGWEESQLSYRLYIPSLDGKTRVARASGLELPLSIIATYS